MKRLSLLLATLIVSTPTLASWQYQPFHNLSDNLKRYQVYTKNTENTKALIAEVIPTVKDCKHYSLGLIEGYSGNESLNIPKTCQWFADDKMISEMPCHILSFPQQKQVLLITDDQGILPIFNDDKKMKINNVKSLKFGIKNTDKFYTFDGSNFSNSMYKAYTQCQLKL